MQFGTEDHLAAPGSAQGNYLIVTDIEAARGPARRRAAPTSARCSTPGRRARSSNRKAPAAGWAGRRRDSYSSFVTFSDPDGNGWLVQEVTTRLPGRIDAAGTTFASVADLAGALRRAAAAHGEHETRTGQADADWPDWYARVHGRPNRPEPELPK